MHRDMIVMGASAGGVEALTETVTGLPGDLRAAVFVVLHLPATATSMLPELLQRCTPLSVGTAADGAAIETGRIYVAPPDHHLLLRQGSIYLSRGPKENGHRPSVDTLFQSAAHTYGPRVIGVVLSGALDDGTMGLGTIARRGGLVAVQDPEDAAFPGMPASALETVPGAIRAPARELGAILGEMSESSIGSEGMAAMADDALGNEKDVPADGSKGYRGPSSVFTCPECHGTLFQVTEAGFERFRCRVGHGFTVESLLADQSEALEAALWTALRSLEERNDLLRRMGERARIQGQYNAAVRFEERVEDGDRNARLLREVLLSGETARAELE